MPETHSGKISIVLLFIIFSGVALLLYLIVGPPKLLARTDRPDFCVKCHTMEPYYEAWFHSGAHRRKACVDCHLPNDNIANHYLWKVLFGVKEVMVYYSGTVPEIIKLTSQGGKVLQSNCIRCHDTTVMLIDTERKCWNCHRSISHMNAGITETL